ncbi:MAG: hypothetical protein QXG86_02095 [Candidatus Woesearchaeota archaeon]
MSQYIFGNDYAMPFDRESYEPPSNEKYFVPISSIGISAHPMREQLEQLKARIFQGASKVELGFMGVKKGSMAQGAVTPEMYGAEEREAIRQLAKINKVELSVHASPSAGSPSGLSQHGFDDKERADVLNEIKRTIDFAADTGGGSVVIHTGEWHRPIFQVVGKYEPEEFRKKFEAYPEEKEKGLIYLADEKTGELQAIRKDIEIWQPKTEIVKDPLTGKEIEKFFYDEKGNVIMEKLNFDEVVKRGRKDNPNLSEEEAVIKFFFDAEKKRYHAEALRWATEARKLEEEAEKYRRAREMWEEIEKRTPKDKLDNLRRAFRDETGLLPPETMLPSEFLRQIEKKAVENINWMREYAVSANYNLKSMEEKIERLKPVEEVGIKKTSDTIAKMAIYAYDVERTKNLQKPIYIAPENMFPEWGYGSHPQELKKIILESRKAMVERLVKERKIDEERAKKIAEEHIKANFDIGHANTWRKFFKGSDPSNIEKTNKEFKEWLLNQVKDLLKSKIIGKVHISDNFGYYDEHLTPGQGIAPIKEFIEEASKAGVKDIIVEPAHQDYKAMLGAWEVFGSSIYSAMVPSGIDRWTDVQHSYFGRTRGPNYLVEETRPSEDWVLWSGVRLE